MNGCNHAFGGLARLMMAASALSLSSAALAQAQATAAAADQAQSRDTTTQLPAASAAEAAPLGGDEIVVTGTRIQGVGPVGSAVISVDQTEMTKYGLGSTADMLRRIPQVLSFGGNEGSAGGAGIQGSDVNYTFANSVNLRGIGTAATLNLVNSHRVPAVGPNSDLFEPDTIPSIALQRIQIVADGASAIYGSDAVAGVANYIMRDPFDGVEASARGGIANDRQDWKASVIAGKTWGSGGIMVAYEHIHRDALAAADRPDLYNDDFSAFGGAPFPDSSFPGNVVTPGGLRAIPAGHATDLTLGDLQSTTNRTSGWAGADALPQVNSDSVVGKFKQELFPGVELYGDGLYYHRDFQINLEAYNTGAAPLSVPASNPYSPCNAAHAPFTNPYGIDCTTNLQVNYNFLNDLGPQKRTGYEEVMNGTVGLKFNLPSNWHGDFYVSRGRSAASSKSSDGQVNAARLNQLLAGSANGIPAFNPFCDGTPGCNSAEAIDYLRVYNSTSYIFKRTDVAGSINGSLFNISGGSVKLSVGGEYYKDDFVGFNENNNNGSLVKRSSYSPDRTVKAVFGEIYIPLVGSANAFPLVEKLELTAAIRYGHYSDAGNTTNPKIGFNWTPVSGLKIHGSYGTSFHAPVLSSNNPYAQAGLLSTTPVLSADLAGTGFTGTASSYTPTYVIGGNGTLKPESATTYSFGADWSPNFARGLDLSVNYYNIDYTNKIDYPAYNAGATAAILSPYFAPYVIRNPAFFTSGTTLTQAEFNTLLGSLISGSPQPANSSFDTVPRLVLGAVPSPATTIAIIDARRNNTGITKTQGLDLSAYYRWTMGAAHWTAGAVGTYVMSYKTSVAPGAPVEEQVNHFGAPLRFQGRGEISADFGAVAASTFLNFANAYSIDRRYIPALAPDSYLHVAAYVTIDTSITYRFGESVDFYPLQNLSLTLSVQNLLDSTPPFVLNSSSSANFPGIKYDNSRANPLGRIVALQVRKSF